MDTLFPHTTLVRSVRLPAAVVRPAPPCDRKRQHRARHARRRPVVRLAGRRLPVAARTVATDAVCAHRQRQRSEEHTYELQSLMRISYAVFCLKKKHTQTSTL